jgi:hypothetical protein
MFLFPIALILSNKLRFFSTGKMFTQIYPLGHFLIAIAQLFLIAWSVRLWLKSKSLEMIVLPIILISLSYDNFLLAAGYYLGEGQLLQFLSQIRFLVHYLLLPFLIIVGVELANRAGAGWAIPLTRTLAWILAFTLGILDILNRYVGLKLEPVYFAGVLRYTTVTNENAPIVNIAVTLFVLLIGIGIWIRSEGKWGWLFVGALVALIGNALPPSEFGTLPSSASELLMALTLLLTERYTQQELPKLGIDLDSDLKFTPLYFNWVLIHPKPQGVIYFIGGAGFGSFPTIFYRYILRKLFQAGYTVVALPFRFTFNHWSVALDLVKDAKPLRESIRAEAERRNRIPGHEFYTNLDLYSDPKKFRDGSYFWLGHSLGCKYVALLELLGSLERLESLSDPQDHEEIKELLGECIKNKKRIRGIEKILEQVDYPEYISLQDQSSILMAPVITGIEGAIPLKFLAKLIKPFIDALPSKEETQCLIKNNNLFHFTSIIQFDRDSVEAKAGTINFLRQTLPQEPFPLLFERLAGTHLAPLNLWRRNQQLATQLIEWLPILSQRIKENNAQKK